MSFLLPFKSSKNNVWHWLIKQLSTNASSPKITFSTVVLLLVFSTTINAQTPCEQIQITNTGSGITIENLATAPILTVQIFNQSWQPVYSCFKQCKEDNTIPLEEGTYYVNLKVYNNSWQPLCQIRPIIEVNADNQNCSPGSACNDNNSCTVDDVYDANCNCKGILKDSDGDGVCDDNDACPGQDDTIDNNSNGIPDGCENNNGTPDCNNLIFNGNGGNISISGLGDAPISIVQIYNDKWQRIYNCTGSNCNSTNVINNLAVGRYYVSVRFYDARWKYICKKQEFVTVTTGNTNPGPCGYADKVADYTGACNNIDEPDYGKSHIQYLRIADASYPDGSAMRNAPNARTISNIVCHQDLNIPDERGLSSLMFTFLQFIDHDITFTKETFSEFLPIPVVNDPYLPEVTSLIFARNDFDATTGTSVNNPRQQVNEITAWIDGSAVYGSDEDRADWLRSKISGKLKVSENNMLPYNTVNGNSASEVDTNAPRMDMDEHGGVRIKVFVAGDIRANEQPGLTAMHTLFVREHNRMCDIIAATGETDDEVIYQQARRYIRGLIQHVLYQECLPALGVRISPYSGYKPNVLPNIRNEFATAAFRVGHTMITTTVPFMDENCEVEEVPLKDAFFNTSIFENRNIEHLLMGLYHQTQEAFDAHVVSDVRNFLFTGSNRAIDLAAINIQRGRDHGLPTYNDLRRTMGLPARTSFSQINSNINVQQKLAEAYDNDIENIDLWIGLISENKLPNSSISETINAILKLQFEALRDSDRFWHEIDNELTETQKQAIKNTKLADIIKRNTQIDNMSNVFFSTDCEPPVVDNDCNNIEVNIIDGMVSVSGLKGAPISALWIFDSKWKTIYRCAGNCDNTVEMNLDNGLYHIIGRYYNASWQPICDRKEDINLSGIDGEIIVASRTDNEVDLEQLLTLSTPNLEQVSLYPNPTTSYFDIDLRLIRENVNLTLYNTIGQEVFKAILPYGQINSVTLPNLENGVYQAVLQLNNQQITRKLVITRP